MKTHFGKIDKSVKGLNNKGFSMLEMLVSFSVFCILASILPLLFQIMFGQQVMDARIQEMEWELFISQLKKEVQRSDDVEIVNGELVLIQEDDRVVFQQYRNVLRRRVNSEGHEVVLQNVSSTQFTEMTNGISIVVEDTFNQTNSATIYFFITAS